MVAITIILSTARNDYPIIGLPTLHIFQPTIESLKIQTFKDFELIIIDALYNKRQNLFNGNIFNGNKLYFPVKHISIEHNVKFNHRFWMNNGRWNVCGALNTGLIHANGELIVRIDDCCEFDSDYLNKFWNGYKNGYFPMAMHIRYLNGKPARLNKEYIEIGYESKISDTFEPNRNELLKQIYGEDGLIRDSRYKTVKQNGGNMIAPYEWYYGYSSVSLEAALKVNGYDELFDGDKSLEDVDMGSRLDMAGYKNKFILDINHQVIEHEHLSIPKDLVEGSKYIKCNYAIYLNNRKNNKYKANSGILSKEDVEFIKSQSLKSPCSPTSNFYDEDCNGKLFKMWLNNQPIFDLREERKLYK